MTVTSSGGRRCEGEIRRSSFDSINSIGWWLDCRSIDLHVTRNSACGSVRHTVPRKQHHMQANPLQAIWSVRVADWRASGGTWYYCAHTSCRSCQWAPLPLHVLLRLKSLRRVCSEQCSLWSKGAIRSQLNWAILLCDVIPDGKNWVNCAILTGNKAGLGTVFSSRLSHREMRTSLRETHSFLSLPADTTMASPQGTSVSSNSFSRWTSHVPFQIPLLTPHFMFSFLLWG